jgi:hypothetical protein
MSMDPGQIVSRLARADTELRLLRRATLDLRAAGQVALRRRRGMTDEPGRDTQPWPSDALFEHPFEMSKSPCWPLRTW